jgi:hypothetical protein
MLSFKCFCARGLQNRPSPLARSAKAGRTGGGQLGGSDTHLLFRFSLFVLSFGKLFLLLLRQTRLGPPFVATTTRNSSLQLTAITTSVERFSSCHVVCCTRLAPANKVVVAAAAAALR